jgi:competence protein ComEA
MTHLWIFVRACVLLAVMGFVVSVPLSPGLVFAAAMKADLLDINTATAEQLKALPGIGDTYSEKIIKGRPYQRKDERVQTQIFPRAKYEQIKYKIVAKGTIH